MSSKNTLLAVLATAFVSSTLAAPLHNNNYLGFGLRRKSTTAPPDFWMPQADFTVNDMIPEAGGNSDTTLQGMAHMALVEAMNMSMSDVDMTDALYSNNGMVQHVHFVQMMNNIPIANAVGNVNIDQAGNVISWAQSFAPMEMVADHVALAKRDSALTVPSITPAQAVVAFAEAMNLGSVSLLSSLTTHTDGNGNYVVDGAPFVLKPIAASVKYYQKEDGIFLSWDLSIDLGNNWHNVFVDATTSDILGMSDWVSQAFAPASANKEKRQAGTFIYNVVPFGNNDVTQNNNMLTTVTNPADPVASRLGWHNVNDGKGDVATTFGNNVVAQQNIANVTNPLGNARTFPAQAFSFNFSFPLNLTADPLTNTSGTVVNNKVTAINGTGNNVNAAVTNAFYIANTMHDVFYHYGFTEDAGNFQASNFNFTKGKGNDPVIATTEDGSGVNNANFAAPPDGQSGRMRMFLFTITTPRRDGALENTIVIHELTHGLSVRLTGGPANSNCLNTLQAGGMGEGWSDSMAITMLMTPQDTRASDKVVGSFVTNSPKGVRMFPYSTNLQTNPLMYNALANPANQEVHKIGEI
ncbi:Fungalysin/Thermolysin Extracellular metalloproteinase 5, partial [Blyttiomyces sp. JEL0837]